MNSLLWFVASFALFACAKFAVGGGEIASAPTAVLAIATVLVIGGFACLVIGWVATLKELLARLRS